MEPPPFVRLVAHPLRWRLVSELACTDLRVRELVALVDEPQNLVSYHLRLLRRDGLVTSTRSTFDGRDSYYHLDLDQCARGLAATGSSIHPALRLAPPQSAMPATRSVKPAVLFACTGNSARSPIAEALLRRRTDGAVHVASAGSRPKPAIHPNAVRVLAEQYGVDLAERAPRSLDVLAEQRFDYVITLCDKVREVCPDFGDHSRRMHWSVPDPAASGDSVPLSYPIFQQVAADLETRIRHLLPVLSVET